MSKISLRISALLLAFCLVVNPSLAISLSNGAFCLGPSRGFHPDFQSQALALPFQSVPSRSTSPLLWELTGVVVMTAIAAGLGMGQTTPESPPTPSQRVEQNQRSFEVLNPQQDLIDQTFSELKKKIDAQQQMLEMVKRLREKLPAGASWSWSNDGTNRLTEDANDLKKKAVDLMIQIFYLSKTEKTLKKWEKEHKLSLPWVEFSRKLKHFEKKEAPTKHKPKPVPISHLFYWPVGLAMVLGSLGGSKDRRVNQIINDIDADWRPSTKSGAQIIPLSMMREAA